MVANRVSALEIPCAQAKLVLELVLELQIIATVLAGARGRLLS
jgi:hypothetical protein